MSTVPAVVPDFFTLPEAGKILRIGRNSAYKLAIEYEHSDGQSGLPFFWVGGLKRVSRLVLEQLLGGPITWPLPDADTTPSTCSCQTTNPVGSSTTAKRDRTASTCPESSPADPQLSLGI